MNPYKILIKAIKDQDYRLARGNEADMPCPSCGERGVFSVNLDNGFFNCFRASCHFTGRLSCIADIDGQRAPVLPSWASEESITLPDHEIVSAASQTVSGRIAYEYVRSRGVTDRQITQHLISFVKEGKEASRILFPIIGNDFKVYDYVTRSIFGFCYPKSTKSDRRDNRPIPPEAMVWNGYTVKEGDILYIAEGVWDALAIERIIKEGTTIALLRSNLSRENIFWMISKKLKKVVVVLDSDAIKAAYDIACRMSEANIPTYICKIPKNESNGKEDPASLNPKDLKKCIESLTGYCFADHISINFD